MTSLILLALILAASETTDALSFKEQCLKWHNYYRSVHQVGKVKWTIALQRKAERWADHLARNNLQQHESGSPDSLWVSGMHPPEPCTEATKSFYSEEKLYNYNKPAWTWEAGHFTQLVWKSTKEIGAAQRVRRDKYLIVVIKYNPGGNVDAPGYYRDNVFPPRYPTNVTTNVTATTVTPLCNITVVVGNTTNATTTVIGVCPTTPLEPVVKAGSRCFRLSAFVGVLCLTIGGVAERVLVSF